MDGRTADAEEPRLLMLGKGWFPDELGGLDRYFREQLEALPEAVGLVVGPAVSAPARVRAVSAHDRPMAARQAGLWLEAQRQARRVDVVDAHFALYSLFSLHVGRLRRKPVVVHFHGPWAEENMVAGDRSGLRHRIRHRLERRVYARAAEAITLSSAFRQVLVERYGVSPWRITVIPPAVDLARFSPGSAAAARARFGLADAEFVAVAVRRLTPRMGLEVLLDAWAEARRELPAGSRLLVAGDGPTRGPLTQQIAAATLTDSVSLLGRIGDEELVDLYRAADVAVVPTVAHEGFGLVVIEAAGCGTPTIVTASGGLPEAISGLDPDLIVAPGEPRPLAARLVDAAHSRIPDRARTRAYAERFAPEAFAARHREVTRRVTRLAAPDDRMRVVYVDHTAKLSGGEIALLRLLPHLDRVRPHVILAEDGPLVEQLHLAGISVEVLPLWAGALDLRKEAVRGGEVPARVAAATAAYVGRLARRLRKLAPDLIHTNSLKAGVYGSLAARLARRPVVWHVRDRIAEDYLPKPAVHLVRRMTRHLATAVVANSHSTMETLSVPRHPLVLYSVLPEVMSDVPRRERTAGGPLTYGIVGRLAPWKGQDLFLRSFAQAFPSGEERAVVVGGALFGEDDYASGLPELADTLGIGERVELRGHRPDVFNELSRLDVLVHASLTPEPFGQVILEGMAAGVPIIAAGAGGPAEILSHERTGLLYPPCDTDALAQGMRRLRDPELRERLRTAARSRLGRYAPAVVAGELQELYSVVTSRSRSRR